jgi:hypothetical protein
VCRWKGLDKDSCASLRSTSLEYKCPDSMKVYKCVTYIRFVLGRREVTVCRRRRSRLRFGRCFCRSSAVGCAGIGNSLGNMRDDTAQTIRLRKFGKKSNIGADPCSCKTHDARLFSGVVVSAEIICFLDPNCFATFVCFRSCGECGPEHSCQTDGTGIEASEDKGMSAGLDLRPSVIVRMESN